MPGLLQPLCLSFLVYEMDSLWNCHTMHKRFLKICKSQKTDLLRFYLKVYNLLIYTVRSSFNDSIKYENSITVNPIMLTWSPCTISITFYFSYVNEVWLDEKRKNV